MYVFFTILTIWNAAFAFWWYHEADYVWVLISSSGAIASLVTAYGCYKYEKDQN